ncbi:hypothetical protein [Paracoccus sp. KR1-242]|uniref:hypothetical protein n=1 Tax=Paracoccus sp. KR1-242 TaxID=3410028 RepID=UPI003C0F8C8A
MDHERRAETVFSGMRDKPLSAEALASAHKHLRVSVPCQNWHSIFKGWAVRDRWPRYLVDSALAYQPGKADSAEGDRNADLLESRRPMMDAWAAFLLPEFGPSGSRQ